MSNLFLQSFYQLRRKLESVKMPAGNVTWVTATAAFVTSCVFFKCLHKYFMGPTKGSDNPKRLDGKVVAVTGANTGIGKVTALELSRKGAKVLLLCRSLEKAELAAQEIREETQNEVKVIKLDLASLKSVRECAETIIKTEDKLDYLINNGGLGWCPESRTDDGFELTIGTNHFGHFLLTELLIDHLKKSASSGHNARIVLVASEAHRRPGIIDFNDINMTKPGSYNRINAYSASKLANVMHGAELARRLEGTGITVYSLHPGVIETEFGRHLTAHWLGFLLMNIVFLPFRIFFKSPFYGSQTTLYCTLEDSISNESGLYYSDCARKEPSKAAQNVEDQQRLWRLSEKMVALHAKKTD